jgi:hypothetical protein
MLELFTLGGDSHEILESVHIEVVLVRVRFRVRVMARVFIFVVMLMFVNCFFFLGEGKGQCFFFVFFWVKKFQNLMNFFIFSEKNLNAKKIKIMVIFRDLLGYFLNFFGIQFFSCEQMKHIYQN